MIQIIAIKERNANQVDTDKIFYIPNEIKQKKKTIVLDSMTKKYNYAIERYSRYCDMHQNVILQAVISERDQLENDMALKLTKYQTISGQLENAKAKVQEQTPAFTVIKSPTVPVKPAGPKRMIFVAFMLILATLGATVWYLRRLILSELI